jgi:hypothetical protein
LHDSRADTFPREDLMSPTRPLRNGSLMVASMLIAAAACACSGRDGGAGGQDDATSRPAQEQRDENAAHPTMHLTGCVERGVIPGSFMLTQVRTAATDAGTGNPVPGGSPGTSGQSDDRATAGGRSDAHAVPADRYTLRSLARGTDLGKFVGKRVAITGRLTAGSDQTALDARGTATPEGTPTRNDRPGGTSAEGAEVPAANVRQLDADSIRTVADTCAPATDRR